MQPEQFDFVIVGAGSAGCALADRLSESGMHRVLLLEAGEADRNLWIHVPLGVGKLLLNERWVWKFSTEPEPGLGGKQVYWPRGRTLGGSSSVNGMVYVRGEAAEYDHWRDLGNPGWGYADVLPYFKRMEAYPAGDPAERGHDGPIQVFNRGEGDRDPLSDAFLAACLEAGAPATDDYNCGNMEGASYLQNNIHHGRRWSSAQGYLRRARRRRNLVIRTGAQANRVLLEAGSAVGIEYLQAGRTAQVHARREVILAAGALQSPQLLELSGIGDGERLRALGIEVRHHLPGVGENLQDHLQARVSYETSIPETINDLMNSRWHALRHGLRYLFRRRGLLAGSGTTVHAIMRTRSDLNRANVKLQLSKMSGRDRYARSREMGIDPFSGFSIGVFELHPRSRGWVHAVSSDPRVAPKMIANYLQDPEDARVLLEAVKLARRIGNQPALRAAVLREVRPGPEVSDDEALMDYIRATAQTSWHPVGSCRMGNDDLAVVDAALRVRGVDRLRVADGAIMPTIPSSNTNAPCMMIGEKAADLLLAAAR